MHAIKSCAWTCSRPLLEHGAEVLVPTREHARALESVQLKAARMILGCPSRTSFDVTRADLGMQLLSSRRDIAKLRWQQAAWPFGSQA